uniref:Uncharacterized protein n=1 Tax=Zooxanthella nutricula TaxID=1333877 RepID=A0A7S2JIE7_9DINO
MRPQDTEGYCKGGKPVSLADSEGLSLAECKGRCAAEEKCLFASYSDRDPLAKVDGSHCMLFDRCEARDAYLPELWWTYEKVDAPTLQGTAVTEVCQRFKAVPDCDYRMAALTVRRLPDGPVEFEFDVGQDVQCAAGLTPDEIGSLHGECDDAPGMSRLAGLTAAPALRGSAHAAPVNATMAGFTAAARVGRDWQCCAGGSAQCCDGGVCCYCCPFPGDCKCR